MTRIQSIGTIIFKALLAFQLLLALGLIVTGIYYQAWFMGLGVLLLASSILASLPVYYPPQDHGARVDAEPIAKRTRGSTHESPSLRSAS